MNSKRIVGIHHHGNIDVDSFEQAAIKQMEILGLSITKSVKNEKICLYEFSKGSIFSECSSSKFSVFIDGYISNIEELKNKFSVSGDSQTIVIEQLLEMGILDIEKYLLGSFSIAILNKKNCDIYLIRDFIGSKPLYYCKDKRFLAFGSEIKLIKCIKEFNLEPNMRRVAQYLCQYKEFPKDTFFNNIFSIEPIHKYTLKKDGIYGAQFTHYKKYSSNAKSFGEAKKELESCLVNSIKESEDILKGDSAVLLSGGLDSSCIFDIFKNHLPNKEIKSISKNFYSAKDKLLDCDETFFQTLMHKNSKNHISVKFLHQSPFENVVQMLKRYDEPFNLANIYLFDEVMKTAKKEGINVIYDGVDGDTVISHGWERFKELFKFHSLPIFLYELLNFAKLHDYTNQTKSSLIKLFSIPLIKKIFLLRPLIKIRDYFRGQPKKRPKIVREEVLENYNYVESYSFDRNFRPHYEKLKNPLIEIGYSNLNILLFEHDIQQVSPFFDRRVVELCLSFPSRYKLNHGKSRYILRETFKNRLPKEIVNRYKKANLTENFSTKINAADINNIRKEVEHIHPKLEKIIDKKNLKTLFGKFEGKTLDDKTNMGIWAFYLTNLWFKMHFKE